MHNNAFIFAFIAFSSCVILGYYFSVKAAFLEHALNAGKKLKANKTQDGVGVFSFFREFVSGFGPFHLAGAIRSNRRVRMIWPALINSSPDEELQNEINQTLLIIRCIRVFSFLLFLFMFFQTN
ncbi:hypothetical protein [Hymenobacter sp. UYCo722]|uniref:hypothetical protein n=1 Tax=Hymenobacter sp. UYCo722 TaxID=3156335 RepID=UPI00339B65F2